ncbi:MAG: sugar ABC transporter ATP-binding protein [Alphaproteobacteria bacterium]|nr:sugar ABC transporter ATP-binding protein [Alphaproteobacteria bacterium]
MTAALIEVTNLTKEYRGIPAIKNISLKFEAGKVHSILGENGAGKSTLTKMIAGAVQPTRGEILLDGKKTTFPSPGDALKNGIAMVFQETSLVPSLTVAQNLFLGDEKVFNRLRGLYISAQQLLQSLNFPVDPGAQVSSLGSAQRQMVEIARAVRKNARLIIFDEPTATLTPEEKQYFFDLIDRLKLRGVGIIFISHALEEALAVSDTITVLRDGEHIETGPASNFDREKIVRDMVGRDLSSQLYDQETKREARPYGEKVLSVQNLSMGRMVHNTSFSVYSGQITGIFGLIGSGRTESFKVVSGVVKRNFFHGGIVYLRDKLVRFRIPKPAVQQGIAYVTEDRKVEGIFETMSVSESIGIGEMAAAGNKSWFVNRKKMNKSAEYWSKALNIKSIDASSSVLELSGGNQQKVVIAKALVQNPQIIIFDEPTRGVDVGAIAEIHEVIKGLAEQGLAVVVISSYLPEILSLSDRILVSRQGRIVEEFSIEEADEEMIMYAAVH